MIEPSRHAIAPCLEATLRPAPDPLAEELLPLLEPPFDRAFDDRAPSALGNSLLRERLMSRVTRSAHASRAFVTVRQGEGATERLAPGVSARLLYACPVPANGRAGEPGRARVVVLEPASRWQPQADAGFKCTEWLVMRGAVAFGAQALDALHYLRMGSQPMPELYSEHGAVLYQRESPGPLANSPDAAQPIDGTRDWQDFAPGIRRRLLWCSGAGEAAMLYLAQPGAAVPRHGHGHDEECLMIDGELFLDDVLLRRGDYQLAPRGSVHGSVTTDTGALLFAHGDIDLDVLPD